VVPDIASIKSLVPPAVASRVTSGGKAKTLIGASNPEESIFVLINPALRAEPLKPGEAKEEAAATARKLLFPDSQKLPDAIASSIDDGTFAKWLGDISCVAVGHLLQLESSATPVSNLENLVRKANAAPKESKLRYVFTFDASCSDPGAGELVLGLTVKLHRFELDKDPKEPDKQVISQKQLMFADTATGKARIEGGSSPSVEQLHVAVKTAFIDAMRDRIALSIVNDLLEGRWNQSATPDDPRGRGDSTAEIKTGGPR
jgi:hypothetical protein